MLPFLFSRKCAYIAQIVHRHLCLDYTLLLYHIATPPTPSTKYIQSALLFAIQQIPERDRLPTE